MSEIISPQAGMQLVLKEDDCIYDQTILHSEGLSDIICSDGTRAILVNGHFLQNEDAVIFQEDVNQFYIDGDNGQILLTDSQDEGISTITSNGQIIQLIDPANNDIHLKEPEIVYITEDNLLNAENISQYQLADSTEDSNTVETQIIDVEELITQDGEPFVLDNVNQDKYQYAILKDGKLHIQPVVGDFIPVIATDETEKTINSFFVDFDEHVLDVTPFTGTHLHKDQILSLKESPNIKEESGTIKHTQKKKSNNKSLENLLNKKLQLGRTPTGKKLVARIVQVKPRNNEYIEKNQSKVRQISNSQCENTSRQRKSENANPNFTFMNTKIVSKEAYQYISRTLEGLMSMDSVKKKLENTNIIVNIVEKKWSSSKNAYSNSSSFTSGYMQHITSVDKDGKSVQYWTFVPDNDTQSYFTPGTRQRKVMGYHRINSVT